MNSYIFNSIASIYAIRAIVLRNRASASVNSTAPMPNSHTSEGHTTAQPAPR